MIDALYDYVSQYPEIVKSRRLAMELVGLVSKPSGRVEADSGCNDDLALSAAMAFYVRKYDMPPLLLNASSLEGNDSFKDIINMNEININEFNDKSIMEYVNENLHKESQDSFVDILSMFNIINK